MITKSSGNDCGKRSTPNSASIRIFEEAATEAIEAAAWYQRERPGLGIQFSAAIDAALDLLTDDLPPLANMPGRAGERGAKRLVLKRFPYNIIVYEVPDEVIVAAVAHHARKPGYWRDR